MLQVLSRRIKRNLVPPRELELQAEHYQAIVSEMLRGDEICHPSERWEVDSLFGKSPEKKASPAFTDMMPAWVGARAEVPVTREIFDEYAGFLETIDELGLLPAHFPNGAFTDDSGLLVCDLGSIIDLNLVVRHLAPGISPPVRILEVGGGYGRLAEAFINVFGDQVSYYLVDAVPLSVYYSQRYLEANLPGSRVIRVGEADGQNIDGAGCHLVPCWHLEKLARLQFDACINVASMQEMTDRQVDFYLELFDRQSKEGAVIYLSNSRDYVYQRDYHYPNSWELLQKLITPRSYSPDYPIEIFRKAGPDCGRDNAAVELPYRVEVCRRYRKEVARLQGAVQSNLDQMKLLRDRIGQQDQTLQRLKSQLSDLQGKIVQARDARRMDRRDSQQRHPDALKHRDDRISALKERVAHQQQLAEKLWEQIEQLRERLAHQQQVAVGLRERIGRLRDRHAEQLAAREGQVEKARAAVQKLKERLAHQQQVAVGLRERIGRLRDRHGEQLAAREVQVEVARAAAQQLRERLAHQRQVAEGLRERIGKLRGRHAEQLAAKEGQVEKARAAAQKLRERLAHQRQVAEGLREHIGKLRERHAEQLALKAEQAQELRAAIEQLKERLRRLQQAEGGASDR